jgi:ribosomal protein S18 acetylase RimI-like enzyme
VSAFAALSPTLEQSGTVGEQWAALADLVGSGEMAAVWNVPTSTVDGIAPGWRIEARVPCVQMMATDHLTGEPEAEAVELGPDDVSQMLDLVRRTEPGPFAARTHTMGRYLGIRRAGRLVAMAGERMHPPGWTEVSAVCTDPAFRGQGLAARLIRAVAHGIRERGETPFLHAAVVNTSAIRLYEALGFEVRARPEVFLLARS